MKSSQLFVRIIFIIVCAIGGIYFITQIINLLLLDYENFCKYDEP